MEKLDARIRNHDREIEKMCNFHHQGFVDAITELLKVRADAEKLMVREFTVKRSTGQKRCSQDSLICNPHWLEACFSVTIITGEPVCAYVPAPLILQWSICLLIDNIVFLKYR